MTQQIGLFDVIIVVCYLKELDMSNSVNAIPSAVKRAAKEYLDSLGEDSKIVEAGMYKGRMMYMIETPLDMCVGFPIVFTYEDGKTEKLGEMEALDVVSTLFDDVED